jgi:hypothetical protein
VPQPIHTRGEPCLHHGSHGWHQEVSLPAFNPRDGIRILELQARSNSALRTACTKQVLRGTAAPTLWHSLTVGAEEIIADAQKPLGTLRRSPLAPANCFGRRRADDARHRPS